MSANDTSGSWEPVWSISNGRTDVDPSALYENDRGRWEVRHRSPARPATTSAQDAS